MYILKCSLSFANSILLFWIPDLPHSIYENQLIIDHPVSKYRLMVPPPDALSRCPFIDELGCGSILFAGCRHVPLNLE